MAYNREDENSGSQERNVMAEYSREEALWTKILRGVFAGRCPSPKCIYMYTGMSSCFNLGIL